MNSLHIYDILYQIIIGVVGTIIVSILAKMFSKFTKFKNTKGRLNIFPQFAMHTIGVIILLSDFLFFNFVHKIIVFSMIVSMLIYMWTILFILNSKE